MEKTIFIIALALSLCIAQNIDISGTVKDVSGNALAGAAIKLEKAGTSATTEADGSFSLKAIAIKSPLYNPGSKTVSGFIKNDLLHITVLKRSTVEVTCFNLRGKSISKTKQMMNKGTHLVPLPHKGTGVHVYKISSGSDEFVLKGCSISNFANGSATSNRTTPHIASAKSRVRFDRFEDVIAIKKDGFLDYRMMITTFDTSGMEISMIVCADTIRDYDGNLYHTVKIGSQEWTVENLRTTKYNDGTEIPFVTDGAAWSTDTTPGYCYFENTTNTDTITAYGALYNWYAINTGKLAPAGWHVSTDAEWGKLEAYLTANGYNWDGSTTGNKVAKATASRTDWNPSINDGAVGKEQSKNNRSGFNGLPGGFRGDDGFFLNFTYNGFWWSATIIPNTNDIQAYTRNLGSDYAPFFRGGYVKKFGFSVRLVRDTL